jgi:hypothetical protein
MKGKYVVVEFELVLILMTDVRRRDVAEKRETFASILHLSISSVFSENTRHSLCAVPQCFVYTLMPPATHRSNLRLFEWGCVPHDT